MLLLLLLREAEQSLPHSDQQTSGTRTLVLPAAYSATLISSLPSVVATASPASTTPADGTLLITPLETSIY